MTTLLDITDTLSPRLAWLAQHGLFTREYQHPHSLIAAHPAMRAVGAQTWYASGNTEQEAELAWAARHGVAHYAIADYERATGGNVGDAAMAVARTAVVAPAQNAELALSQLEGWDA